MGRDGRGNKEEGLEFSNHSNIPDSTEPNQMIRNTCFDFPNIKPTHTGRIVRTRHRKD